MKSVLKLLAVSVALLFLLGAMLTAVTELFGGSKVRPLFGMSMDALAAGPADSGVAKKPTNKANSANNANNDDLGLNEPTRFSASKSAPVPLPRRAKDGGTPPTFFPASKSMGGEGLPGLKEELNPPPQQQQAPTQTPQQQK
ncbi:MAG: hypothetical protein JNM17_03850 [Archangium sp.]|nr:hypothetical protein [Archangium sp.]